MPRKKFAVIAFAYDAFYIVDTSYFKSAKKINIFLESFSKHIYNIWVIFRLISVFETTALLNLPINSIFLWLLLPDLIGSLMRLL